MGIDALDKKELKNTPFDEIRKYWYCEAHVDNSRRKTRNLFARRGLLTYMKLGSLFNFGAGSDVSELKRLGVCGEIDEETRRDAAYSESPFAFLLRRAGKIVKYFMDDVALDFDAICRLKDGEGLAVGLRESGSDSFGGEVEELLADSLTSSTVRNKYDAYYIYRSESGKYFAFALDVDRLRILLTRKGRAETAIFLERVAARVVEALNRVESELAKRSLESL